MSVDYRPTVFLPKTDFPMRGGLAQREPETLARWEEMLTLASTIATDDTMSELLGSPQISSAEAARLMADSAGSAFDDRFRDFMSEVPGYIRDGRVRYHESVTEGLENAPAAFLAMLKGGNFGKTLVKVAD